MSSIRRTDHTQPRITWSLLCVYTTTTPTSRLWYIFANIEIHVMHAMNKYATQRGQRTHNMDDDKHMFDVVHMHNMDTDVSTHKMDDDMCAHDIDNDIHVHNTDNNTYSRTTWTMICVRMGYTSICTGTTSPLWWYIG